MGSDLVSDELLPFAQAFALLTVLTMAVTDIMARCLFKRPTSIHSSGVINTLINFSSLNYVLILVILYKIFVTLVFDQFGTYGTTPTLGLLGFVVTNKNVRVHICVRARRQLEMATVGGGEGLVAPVMACLGRFSSRVKPSAIADSADHPMSHPSGAGPGGAVFTVSAAAVGHSQVVFKEGGRRGPPRQAW